MKHKLFLGGAGLMETISLTRNGTDGKYIKIDSSEILDAISDDQDVKTKRDDNNS